jgi:hypothetical protein
MDLDVRSACIRGAVTPEIDDSYRVALRNN